LTEESTGTLRGHAGMAGNRDKTAND